jgi:hypothetical protein
MISPFNSVLGQLIEVHHAISGIIEQKHSQIKSISAGAKNPVTLIDLDRNGQIRSIQEGQIGTFMQFKPSGSYCSLFYTAAKYLVAKPSKKPPKTPPKTPKLPDHTVVLKKVSAQLKMKSDAIDAMLLFVDSNQTISTNDKMVVFTTETLDDRIHSLEFQIKLANHLNGLCTSSEKDIYGFTGENGLSTIPAKGGDISLVNCGSDKESLCKYGRKNHDIYNIRSGSINAAASAYSHLISNKDTHYRSVLSYKKTYFDAFSYAYAPSLEIEKETSEYQIELLTAQNFAESRLDVLLYEPKRADILVGFFLMSRTHKNPYLEYSQTTKISDLKELWHRWLIANERSNVHFGTKTLSPFQLWRNADIIGKDVRAIADVFFNNANPLELALFILAQCRSRLDRHLAGHIATQRSVFHLLYVLSFLGIPNMEESKAFKVGRLVKILNEIQSRYHFILHGKTDFSDYTATLYIDRIVRDASKLGLLLVRMIVFINWAKTKAPDLYRKLSSLSEDVKDISGNLSDQESLELMLGYLSNHKEQKQEEQETIDA